ncbi:hypothetical protein P7K49_004947 [Saguinus oedipus]|uniref:Uncharacterized protein n=1 Tax=Saguinus oedipus TaxID=9490 RepID=A0ABQ9W9A4_SAGOE|nr:hypothetical protein P7K49_004947 [Saguinus oedipus]
MPENAALPLFQQEVLIQSHYCPKVALMQAGQGWWPVGKDFELNNELKMNVLNLLEEVLRDPDLLPQERKATANILREVRVFGLGKTVRISQYEGILLPQTEHLLEFNGELHASTQAAACLIDLQ